MAVPVAAKSTQIRVTIHPLKGFSNSIGSLRERYSEDTADVFFVDKETKERVPAHREVLKVASAVFFKMFDGDWKEKGEKEIPAPEEYNWESFKAAIALLYGEEVEVEESSIPDIYRVAHCYDLGEVLPIIVREVSQWGDSLIDTALELCILAPEEKELMEAVVKLIALSLSKIQKIPLRWHNLPFDAMLMLVQSNDISAPEEKLHTVLNSWTAAQPEVPLQKVLELYGHIRYGIIPYEKLLSRVTHKNFITVFKMHQCLSVDQVKENLIQLTPRPFQEDVFQVYPMARDQAVARQRGKWQFLDCSSSHSVGVIYAGKQECTFEVDIRIETRSYNPTVFCKLTSVYHVEKPKVVPGAMSIGWKPVVGEQTLTASTSNDCHHLVVTLNPRGAHVVVQGSENAKGERASKRHRLMCSEDFPWLFEFRPSTVGVTLSFIVHHPI